MPQEFYSNPKSGLSKNLKIGVLCGGLSSERKISRRSGRAVDRALKRLGFSTFSIDPADTGRLERSLKKIDMAFLALHGRGGEDGKIQRLLEGRRIPYTGSDAVSSRRAFDKEVAKKLFQKTGIPTAPYVIVKGSDWEKKLRRFPVPFFVKPLCEGSSIGAFPVEDLKKSAEKLKAAVAAYGKLVVEKRLEGREFTVGILGGKPLPVIELRPKRTFYDYRAKYTKGMTEYLVPAPIAPRFCRRLQRLAVAAHKALGLRDFSRVDLMTDDSGRPYVLEANSIPGFTELSLLPKAARAAGISFEELCARLVGLAHARRENGKKAA